MFLLTDNFMCVQTEPSLCKYLQYRPHTYDKLSIQHTHIHDNSGVGGGAIRIDNLRNQLAATHVIHKSTFDENYATFIGGAVVFEALELEGMCPKEGENH